MTSVGAYSKGMRLAGRRDVDVAFVGNHGIHS